MVACARATLSAALSLWVETGQCPGGIDLLQGGSQPQSPPRPSLEGGRYDLALRALVPSSTHLPPSHTLPTSQFSMTYSLRAELSCVYDGGVRRLVGAAELPFELLPATLPRPPPPIPPHSVWITALHPPPAKAPQRTARWVLHPRLPSSVFSPTERIPITLRVMRPDAPRHSVEHVMIVRASLVREERVATGPQRVPPIAAVVASTTTLAECTPSTEVRLDLALMQGTTWGHGYTVSTGCAGVRASSTFHVRLHVLIAPRAVTEALERDGQTDADILDSAMSSSGHTPGTAMRTFTLPVEIGSVGEPRSAEYAHSWTDVEWCADGTGHLVSGSAITSENGWVVPPPSYREALLEAPYVVS